MLNLATMKGMISVDLQRLKVRVSRFRDARLDTETTGSISDADVDDAIRDIDLSRFHLDVSMQTKFRTIPWRHSEILKGLATSRGLAPRHTCDLCATCLLPCQETFILGGEFVKGGHVEAFTDWSRQARFVSMGCTQRLFQEEG